MNYRSMRREETSRRMAMEHLKVCPLCGAVNAHLSTECFVCRWQGEFSFDAEDIEDGVAYMMVRCPELVDVFAPSEPPRRTLLDRVRTFFYRRRVQRKLDLLA